MSMKNATLKLNDLVEEYRTKTGCSRQQANVAVTLAVYKGMVDAGRLEMAAKWLEQRGLR